MKKVVLFFLLAMLAVSVVSAEDINLGKFPLGEWLDTNYDAYWVFESDNIMIKQNGAVVFDFKDQVENFKLEATMAGEVEMKFSCDEAGRDYTISNKMGSTDITLMFKRDDGVDYSVNMKRQ
ncbi:MULTISPECIES: hypothetical protein [unclassified Oceanispirochaeta]|uniref:hypothetical protein n=1 Tax=unclassified Oceanispirochaeta TaxID=2635722 RepID=UPI000E09A895|nr:MULTISPECIES: hypothetical protein [unclassified Oceanispirochaeta]MBF9016487.1 hypothetical protein [Oceanispirochaeta sp. M2]NPD72949.1 hypothetical protein [Oceanispirochaeta sp. M1]RDG31523.1 hypothetical protein DV872_12640 [Oceanispirochaeta sp. M1]